MANRLETFTFPFSHSTHDMVLFINIYRVAHARYRDTSTGPIFRKHINFEK